MRYKINQFVKNGTIVNVCRSSSDMRTGDNGIWDRDCEVIFLMFDWLKRPLDTLKQSERPSETSAHPTSPFILKEGQRFTQTGHVWSWEWQWTKERAYVCAMAQICVCSGWTGWTSAGGGLEELEWDECWGLMPLLLTYWRNWSGISARTSLARRAMLRMWFPLRSM